MATATDSDSITTSDASALEGLTLETERGVTTISNDVVAKLAGQACREVAGVAAMGASFRRLLGRVRPGSESLAQGVNVEVGKKEAAIDLVIIALYGNSIPAMAQEVRDNVIAKVETGTGLVVKEVNIEVDDLQFPEQQPASARVE
ncbi:MAG: Asp23/Gls24 family envelope stress response protein [Acidimicrobiales bacterium]